MNPRKLTGITLVAFLLIAFYVIYFLKEVSKSDSRVIRQTTASYGPAKSHELGIDFKGIQKFSEWMNSFRNGNRQTEFILEGLKLAKTRHEAMLSLIKEDAKAALEEAIGYADYHQLPVSIQALVEEPFTMRGNIEVLAVCDDDHQTPEYQTPVYDETGSRFKVGSHEQWRTELSKLNVPLQGIKLDNWMALDPTVFDPVDGPDAEWGRQSLPSGNADPSLDFLTGEALGLKPVTALAGGYLFNFANANNLTRLEEAVRQFTRKEYGQFCHFPRPGSGSGISHSADSRKSIAASGK